MAKVICRRVSELLADGQRPEVVYGALDLLCHRFRDEGYAVERDAMAEVLDRLEDEGLPHTA